MTSITFDGSGILTQAIVNASIGSATDIIITGYSSIGDSAFNGRSLIKSVSIPNTVTSIGNTAFNNNNSLANVIIPNSVISIGISAFQSCNSLTSITLPNSVKSIGNSAFQSCIGLTSVIISNLDTTSGPSITFGQQVFQSCTSLNSVTIGNSVTNIGIRMFQSCTSLTSITIPSSVTTISNSAFYNCSGLTSITIPNSITTIGTDVFQGCISLTSITLPNNSLFTSIGGNVFRDCSGITSITIPSSVTSIGVRAFFNCSSLTSVTFNGHIPTIASDNFTKVGDTAYYYTAASNIDRLTPFFTNSVLLQSEMIPNPAPVITAIKVSNNTATINFIQTIIIVTATSSYQYSTDGGSTWVDASETNNPIVINNLTNGITYNFTIRNYNGLYSEASNIVNETVNSDTVTRLLGSDMLSQAIVNAIIGLSSNIIITGYSSIGNSAFQNNAIIKNVIISDSVTSIGNFAFGYCAELTSITIPNTIISIGNQAFQTCSKLTSITLPTNPLFTSINYGALSGCTGLTSITIPSNVKNIGQYAFNDSTNLTSVTFNGNIPIIAPNNFTKVGDTAYYYTGASNLEYLLQFTNTVPIAPIVPIPICFPAGTPVLTDQGIINIEKINPSINTIRGNKIVSITKTITIEDKIICIEKDALGTNIPSKKTYISRNHKLFYNKQMIKAKNLIGQVDGVYNDRYNGEILYNVLLDKHDKMTVNNLIVETLDPNNIVAKLYDGSLNLKEINTVIVSLNNGAKEYKKQFGKLR